MTSVRCPDCGQPLSRRRGLSTPSQKMYGVNPLCSVIRVRVRSIPGRQPEFKQVTRQAEARIQTMGNVA